MNWTRTHVYLDAEKLKKQARKWAKTHERSTGVKESQPNSVFVRWLVDRYAAGKVK